MAKLEPGGEPLHLTTTAQTALTVPAGKIAVITGAPVANVDGTNDVDVTLQWTDASNSGLVTRLAFNVTVEAQDARSMLVEPVTLNEGDELQALASANNAAELTLSYYTEDV